MKITIQSGNQILIQEYREPVRLSTAIRESGLPFAFPCSGQGRCGKCRVFAEGELSEPGEQERQLLGEALADGVRLACLAEAAGDCRVTLPEEKEASILTEGRLPEFTLTPGAAGYGCAVDIGTTTVACYVWSRNDGQLRGKTSFPNPQSKFGADVISRIQCHLDGEGEALRAVIFDGLDQALSALCREQGIEAAQVSQVVVTGNTTMLDLFAGIDVEPLSHSPFQLTEWFGHTAEFRFPSLPDAPIYLPRTIAAFVGSDITCAILASGMLRSEETRLLADIGTNGEMALWHDGKLSCCSTAAGPAFEGAGIWMGMAAVNGALNGVSLEGETLRYRVIGGGGRAAGVCGSGLIDAMAAFLKLGLIDDTGRIDEDSPHFAVYGAEVNDQPALRIGDSGVILTQQDVRSLQLAKSAICAGMETLLHEAGTDVSEVKELLLAGGFGSYIDTASAAVIGLLPHALASRATAIGNAAGMGASMMLLSEEEKAEGDALAREGQEVELSTTSYFMDRYVENMMFEL